MAWALLCVHVDDGHLMGDDHDPHFRKLKEEINSLFKIKAWSKVPMTFLGVEVKWDGKTLVDTMASHIQRIKQTRYAIDTGNW